MISANEKKDLIAKFGKNPQDSGSTEVQIAILTTRINNLKSHFDKHIHDYHSNRGLMKMIGRRRRLLKYYHNTNRDNYGKLIKELGLRK